MIGTLLLGAAMCATTSNIGASAVASNLNIGASAVAPNVNLGDTVAVREEVRLQEVSVVGVKQNASLLRDAVSGTVLTTKALENRNVMDIKGVSDMVPNLFIPDYGSRVTSSIYVRGIGSRMDQPAVGLTVDNVPMLNKNSYDFDVMDIASVEVLRGPQSALYGRNTMGGLINITTLSPMLWRGKKLFAEYGTSNRLRLGAGIYEKFGDNLGISLSANMNHSGGYFINEHDGQPVDRGNDFGLRLKTHYRPADRIYIKNVLAGSVTKQGGYPYEYLETGKIAYDDTCSYHRLSLMDGLSLNYRGDGWQLHSISSVQLLQDTLTMDQDFLPIPYFTLVQKQREVGVTQDLLFKGRIGLHDNGSYNWLAGVFAFYKNLDMKAPVTFKDEGIANMIESHRNEMNPYYPIKWDTRSFVLNSDFTIPTFGVALYHESKLSWGNWDFTAGMRLDYETSKLNYRSHCNTGYTIYQKTDQGLKPFAEIPIVIDDRGNLRRSYFNWIPKLSALYNLPDGNGNLYFSVSKGYKSGGFNTQMFSDVLKQRLMGIMGIGGSYDVDDVVGYKPEHSWNYELGTHLPLRGVPLSIDATLFYIDCSDQQITVFPNGDATGRITANAGRTRSVGGEMSAAWHPLAWLDFNASYGFTDARFVNYFNGKQDFKGNRIPYAPQSTLFVQGVGKWDVGVLGMNRVVVDMNLRGTGPIYWNEENSIRQEFYPLAGGSVTMEFDKVSVQLWGENITGTRFNTFYFKSMGNEFLQRGLPARGGVTMRLSF